MNRIISFIIVLLLCLQVRSQSWIRINQLGYTPGGIKVAVYGSKGSENPSTFRLIEARTGKKVFEGSTGRAFGAYGPFNQSCRLDFTKFKRSGRFYLEAGTARSPEFRIDAQVYQGTADFCLRYMRQQRTGFNPYLQDSCHTHDGYVLYGEGAGIKDSTRIDVVGGWHDASDYLQYSTTSANATYHLLKAYRDFPNVFSDSKRANGLDGSNGIADVLDEAKWGLDWLLKMHPRPDWMFNQIADDRDHMGMRMPKEDSFYGRGFERPVYFVSGEPQQRGKFMNNSTGTSSTAGKFASAFALGAGVFSTVDTTYSHLLFSKAQTAFDFGRKKMGVSQTASVRSPYIYAEDNWKDDLELAAIQMYRSSKEYAAKFPQIKRAGREMVDMALQFAREEPITPWLGDDTAKHYQWYPFINLGHYELARELQGAKRDRIINYYREGIERVWKKARSNAFYRGVPFIWCSNNLTASFAIQCYWYRQLTADKAYSELEQANIDWLFGCNPWGTSMVYGLPADGDTPVDPHSAFTHIKNYPIDGGLVDGPVYGSIYGSLIGIQLKDPDEYAGFQSNLAVYHDDYGDYSTNEPTMDGTASLVYLLAARENEAGPFSYDQGAIIRGDMNRKQIALVFTGDEFADGGRSILKALRDENVKASFFLTGRFLRNASNRALVKAMKKAGHYLGAHSNEHLLYCDWSKRDSLLVTREVFNADLLANYRELAAYEVSKDDAPYFLPPYEWYNDSIALWTKELGLQLVNYSPGTRSTADYTYPGLKNYMGSDSVYESIMKRERATEAGLNGFILLVHVGTDPRRTDKFYERLPQLLKELKKKGYGFTRIDGLLEQSH